MKILILKIFSKGKFLKKKKKENQKKKKKKKKKKTQTDVQNYSI
jgi:hypothetical protein